MAVTVVPTDPDMVMMLATDTARITDTERATDTARVTT